jgi:chromosome segregation ATPase
MPGNLSIDPKALQKAYTPQEPSPEPARPLFDEAKLNRLIERATTLNRAANALCEERRAFMETLRRLEQQRAQAEYSALNGHSKAVRSDSKRALARLEAEVDRARAQLNAMNDRWEKLSEQSKRARGLADRLERFARDNLGWSPVGEPRGTVRY